MRKRKGYEFAQGEVAAMLRMEMGRVVIIKEQLDDDAEKTGDLRHLTI